MQENWNVTVEIPEELGGAVQAGISRGRSVVTHRKRVRKYAVRTALSAALVVTVFAGSVNMSPAFASALEDVPILGTLVRVFQLNAPEAEGGQPEEAAAGTLTLEQLGDTEWLTLKYERKSAARYHAELASFPRTLTLTLPGTEQVTMLSDIDRARETSHYIKSVYTLDSAQGGQTTIQIEFENDADVQIQEYQDPGSVVIRLTSAEYQLSKRYSLRSLSFDNDAAFAELAQKWSGQNARFLQDEQGKLFLEFAQYGTRDEAEKAASAAGEELPLIVEARYGNNAPACFTTLEQYRSAQLLNEYQELLLQSFSVDPILEFLDGHLADATPEEQDAMLRGLTGFLDGGWTEIDTARLAPYYALAGQELLLGGVA
ncbi:MAG: DUF4179 domain-containing protein, partial [Clostridia bacterium]|nr:DUF4179 domain-containing protein [Clostridia bacterium]